MKVTECVYSRHKIITAAFVLILSSLYKRFMNFKSGCFWDGLNFKIFNR